MIIVSVKILDSEGIVARPERFLVVMPSEPGMGNAAVDLFMREVRRKVRAHEEFRRLFAAQQIPHNYQLDSDLVNLNEDYVSLIG